ncbi:hypothetical protein EON81_20390 [bacterium]|nr:MAG: hypothetical protein EON81_20390 [bacterium]
MVSGFPKATTIGGQVGMTFDGDGDGLTYPWDDRRDWPRMPKRDFTVSVWFAIPSTKGAQGVMGCIFEPKEGLTGWRFLTRGGRAEFTLANSGKGEATVTHDRLLSADKVHRLDASYDGQRVRFFVDGALAGEKEAPFGDIVYNGRAGICFGDWWEGPRSFRFKGFLSQAALFDQALTPGEVDGALAEAPTQPMPIAEVGVPKFTIAPYFQYPTAHEATVMWETSTNAPTRIRFGESPSTAKEVLGEPSRIHRIALKGLKPSTTYFVQADSSQGDSKLKSEWASFRTGALPGTPVKFAIVGDTQDHPEINHRIAEGMFAARPDFAVIVGDLVGLGWKKEQYVNDFFGSMRPLLSHVPLLPVLGNHDRNARNYYDLFSMPEPKFCYRYQSGDVEIWSVDTDHDVEPGSPQYRWLEETLSRSKAKWKIVAHHYPPYSSDIDDYGDATAGPIEGGDLQARKFSALYDKYGVDLCFSGHIHSYERTYPMRGGKVVSQGKGTVYVVVGGGGGGLEQAAPTRADFTHTVRSGHHFGVVWADPHRLEFRAYDLESRLFDSFELEK